MEKATCLALPAQSEKLVSYILASDYHGNRPLKPYTKTEIGTCLVMYDVYFKTHNVDVKNRIETPGIQFQDQTYSKENIQTITELMN